MLPIESNVVVYKIIRLSNKIDYNFAVQLTLLKILKTQNKNQYQTSVSGLARYINRWLFITLKEQ